MSVTLIRIDDTIAFFLIDAIVLHGGAVGDRLSDTQQDSLAKVVDQMVAAESRAQKAGVR